MVKTIRIAEAQAEYKLAVDEAQLAQEPIILERDGEPIAAIIPFREYREFLVIAPDTWHPRANSRAYNNESRGLTESDSINPEIRCYMHGGIRNRLPGDNLAQKLVLNIP
jgi:antitoxin (DNA-binding transcriptional repressor) of toxin-antitoxin stability system